MQKQKKRLKSREKTKHNKASQTSPVTASLSSFRSDSELPLSLYEILRHHSKVLLNPYLKFCKHGCFPPERFVLLNHGARSKEELELEHLLIKGYYSSSLKGLKGLMTKMVS